MAWHGPYATMRLPAKSAACVTRPHSYGQYGVALKIPAHRPRASPRTEARKARCATQSRTARISRGNNRTDGSGVLRAALYSGPHCARHWLDRDAEEERDSATAFGPDRPLVPAEPLAEPCGETKRRASLETTTPLPCITLHTHKIGSININEISKWTQRKYFLKVFLHLRRFDPKVCLN